MLADMHVHTEFSGDCSAKMDNMAQKAISLGIPMITITDHIDWDFPEPEFIFDIDMEGYQAAIKETQERYKGVLDIRMGVELGMQPHLVARYQEYLRQYPFDFVIASVHLLQNRDPYYQHAFEGLTDTQAYRMYFEAYLENIRCFHDFDALGHLDYVVRYGREKEKSYRCSDYWDILDEILKNLVAYDKALEINAAGFRKNLGFPNPHGDIIKRFRELGGEKVTVGCDAHKPTHIGKGLKQTEDLLLDCGFQYYTQYKLREPEFVKI